MIFVFGTSTKPSEAKNSGVNVSVTSSRGENAAAPEVRFHRDRDDLDRRRLGGADLGVYLIRRAAGHLAVDLRDDEPVYRLDDIPE